VGRYSHSNSSSWSPNPPSFRSSEMGLHSSGNIHSSRIQQQQQQQQLCMQQLIQQQQQQQSQAARVCSQQQQSSDVLSAMSAIFQPINPLSSSHISTDPQQRASANQVSIQQHASANQMSAVNKINPLSCSHLS